jgi:energy-coupling factor transporter ATP-binding protein EcfA2
MYVQSLKLSGFMSFKDVTWKPECLNVLIGPNGSGKSNLLRALELIRASAAGNLRDFVLSKGGLPRLLWGDSAHRAGFEARCGDSPGEQHTYRFALTPVPQSASFRIASDGLEFGGPSAPFRALERDQNGLVAFEGTSELVHDPGRRLPETETPCRWLQRSGHIQHLTSYNRN